MPLSDAELKAAHRHSSQHEPELLRSSLCGCFYCQASFSPAEIQDWVDEPPRTALCPRCGIDSVIGDASAYAVGDADFLSQMHAYWFERTVSWDEGLKQIRRSRSMAALRRFAAWLGIRS